MDWLEGDALRQKTEIWNKIDAERQTSELSRKKVEAQKAGKEPFNLGKLRTLIEYIPYQEKDLEYIYYIQQSSLMTLDEFARSIQDTNRFDHG